MDDLKTMALRATMIADKPGLTRLKEVKPLGADGERIVIGVPPNYPKILAAFPAAEKTRGVIFAYGSTIFNRDGVTLEQPIVAHELVHLDQQKKIGVEVWWDRYIAEPDFRYLEELQAHQVEYFWATQTANRNVRRAYLSVIAKRLSSPLYGSVVTLAAAKKAIKGEIVNG